MPRLLILCEYPTLLGGERSMLSTLPAVAADGFDVQVAAPDGGPLADAIRAGGVELVPWSVHGEHGTRRPLGEQRQVLADLIRHVRPQLLHANSLSMARLSGPVAAELHVPSLGHLRDILKLSRLAVEQLNQHDRLIAVSAATRAFHVEQGLARRRCVVVHNGVDLQEFQPRRATRYLHRELALSPQVRLVATIGQLGLRKATDVALQAAEQVTAELPEVRWLVIGERTSDKKESRDFERALHAAAQRAPLAGRVCFLSRREDVARLVNECDLLVHAARQEPLGRVLLEAAASGLPVVATDVGGTREIFPTPHSGALLVPAGDAHSLARAALEILRDDTRHATMVAAARRRAEDAFDIRTAARRLVEQYREIVSI